MFRSKKGVSLITVLMFMLVTTIAATATFKWLTSENRSSASRMLRQEAYQSSVAGIENARAWMSNHPNDVGALIKQYYDNQKRPILLNSVLPQLDRNGQSYNVWLTAVNTSSTTYKLKLLSEGNGRNDSKHTEAAIIRVDGLYRIRIPQSSEKFTFNKAFHGASDGITGTDTIGSGNINGDWEYSNNPVVKGDMIVTGNTKYGGTVHHYGDFYLGGNLTSDGQTIYGTEGLDTSVIYIGGNVTCPSGQPITVYGDLYVKGDISELCKVDVKGNLTIGGHIVRNNDHYITVGKNWVFTNQNSAPEEQLEIGHDFPNNNTSFSVGRNLYLPYKLKAHCSTGNNCGDSQGKRGFTVGGNVYQYKNSPFVLETQEENEYGYSYGAYMDGYTRPFNNDWSRPFCSDDHTNCKRGRIFSFNANSISTDRVQEWKETDNVLKNISDNYWQHINRINKYGKMINKTTNRIPEPIMLKNETAWKAAKANSFCGFGDWFAMDNNFVSKLNMCYVNAKNENKLYNDEYLIIEWNNQEQKDITTKLIGKFVFYVPEAIGQTYLPPTSDGSYVFLYLEKGTKAELLGHLNLDYNYLIYSKDDIQQINGLHIKGSVVMADGKALKKYQGGNNLEFNGDVLKSLANAGIIKENPEYTKLTGEDEVEEGSSSTENTNVYDTYYIATASQLALTLESQYESREELETSGANAPQAISPTVLILPRAIYITRNADGKLEDYYNIINLNGANEQKDPSRVNCNPSLNTYGPLYQNNVLISEDVYTCNYQSENYGDIPFYVVVSGESGKTPKIFMDDDYIEITTSDMKTVSARVSATSPSAQEVSIDISVSKPPDGWTVTPVSGTELTLRESSDIEKVYTLTFRPNVSTIDLFTVTTTATAPQGQVHFYLRSPMLGCTIAPPSDATVIMTGYVSVERGSISQYCSKSENAQICSEKGYDKKADYLDCDDFVSGEWVRASGTNVTVVTPNNKWSVGTNTAISLKDMHNVPDYCELLLPTENNIISQADQNGEYTLYASLKRKRYTLTVKTENATDSDSKVSVYYGEDGEDYADGTSSICEKNSDGNLVCDVYAGWYVKTTYTEGGDDKFSRWECTGDNCPNPSSAGKGANITSRTYELQPISSDNTITAVFNDRDKHCFYEDFTDLTAFCSGNQIHCINSCEGGSNYSCSVSGVNAEWQLMYPNNGNSSSVPPVIQNGYITSNNSAQTGNSTIILSTKEAGIHGTMTAMLQTTILENRNKSLNSGFIFSSDATASSFTILNIYGDASNSKALTARVCEGTQSTNTVSHINCNDEVFKNSNSRTVSINSEDMIKLEIELTIENKLKIKATSNNENSSVELDISSYMRSRDEHSRYVGFNVSDPSFRLYDIGWSSYFFADECFENPTISCSFAANYLGGRVPLEKNVKPWVGVSSWFEDNNCTLTYYYNGCDNATGNSTSGCSNGVFNRGWITSWYDEHKDGTFFGATLNSSTYNFSTDGLHGTTVVNTYGYTTYKTTINDAKVKITCDDETSLNGKWTSCGMFQVGDIERCAQNAEILGSSATPKYGSADVELEIPVGEGDAILNLRSTTLWIDISGFTEGDDKIILYLKDQNDNLSIPREMNSNGLQSFDVDVMSNLDSFDPQTVKSIVLKSSLYPYQVNSVMSSCPYALNINNCKASYNGISWRLTSTITNLEGAAVNGCSVTGIESMTDVSCPENGVFAFNEEGLYEQVNSSGFPVTREFEIVAKSADGGEVSCKTEPVTIAPINITCSVAEENVVKGAGMPALTFSFEGCPNSTCDYTLSVENEESVEGSGTGESSTWTPSINVSPALSSDSYIYYVIVSGVRKECGTVTVENASEASVSNCQLEKDGKELENYKFTADVTPANDGSAWNMQVMVFDHTGNVVKKEPKDPKKSTDPGTQNGTYFEAHIPTKDLAAGNYSAQLFLNGETVANSGCHISFGIDAVSSSSSATPVSSSSTPKSSSSKTTQSSSSVNQSGVHATCSFEKAIIRGASTANFIVSSMKGMEKDMQYGATFTLKSDYYSNGFWFGKNESKTLTLQELGKISNPGGTYTLYTEDDHAICSAELETIEGGLENCEISKTNVLVGSQLTISGNYIGASCNNAWIDIDGAYVSGVACNIGAISETFFASNDRGTKSYVLHVNGIPNTTCSFDVTTGGYTIKQLGGHDKWNDWNTVDVACNDSVYIKVSGDANRTVYCRSDDKKGHITIRGAGFGSNSNASTCNSNGICEDATLGLCIAGENPCERVIYTSCTESMIKCRVE